MLECIWLISKCYVVTLLEMWKWTRGKPAASQFFSFGNAVSPSEDWLFKECSPTNIYTLGHLNIRTAVECQGSGHLVSTSAFIAAGFQQSLETVAQLDDTRVVVIDQEEACVGQLHIPGVKLTL